VKFNEKTLNVARIVCENCARIIRNSPYTKLAPFGAVYCGLCAALLYRFGSDAFCVVRGKTAIFLLTCTALESGVDFDRRGAMNVEGVVTDRQLLSIILK
jgi:hypothetical protein